MKRRNTNIMYPFVKYPGGKSKEIPLVLNNLPNSIDRYVEPFVGGGSIFFAMNIRKSLINDKSKDLYSLYMLIKEQNIELKNYLLSFNSYWHDLEENHIENISFSEDFLSKDKFIEFYRQARRKKDNTITKIEEKGVNVSEEDKNKIEITARKTAFYMLIRYIYNKKNKNNVINVACFYFLREYCYSSMFRFSSKGEFNVPYGGMSYNTKYLIDKINYIFSKEMKDYLSETIIQNKDFEEFMNSINLNENDFIFLDPPYDTDFSTYDNNPFDRNEQIRLKEFLEKTPAKWLLIIKKTDFIYQLYKDFNIYEYDKNYMVSFKNRNDKEVKHLLITNYELSKGEER